MKRKGSRLGFIVFVGIVTFILYTSVISNVKVREKDGTWQVVWEGSLAEAVEADPGAGASGFLEIFFLNHTATPTTAYDDNVSSHFETWCNASLDVDGAGAGYYAYANADEFNLQLKHSVLMDVVVRVRYNKTHAWNGTAFVGADCRVNITASGGGITILASASGTNVISYNNSGGTYIYINVVFNNGGAGYTLAKGGTCTISQVSIQAKY